MYESKISDAKWIAYDIPGNVGWIAFLVGLGLCFVKRPEITENKVVFSIYRMREVQNEYFKIIWRQSCRSSPDLIQLS